MDTIVIQHLIGCICKIWRRRSSRRSKSMLEGGEIAAQVVPPLPDKEMTTMFISSSSATFA